MNPDFYISFFELDDSATTRVLQLAHNDEYLDALVEGLVPFWQSVHVRFPDQLFCRQIFRAKMLVYFANHEDLRVAEALALLVSDFVELAVTTQDSTRTGRDRSPERRRCK